MEETQPTDVLTEAALEFQDIIDQFDFISQILDESTETDPLTLECRRQFKTVLGHIQGNMVMTLSFVKEFLKTHEMNEHKEKTDILERFEDFIHDTYK